MRSVIPVLVASALALAPAQDPVPAPTPEAPAPEAPAPSRDESSERFHEALELQRRGRWESAKRKLEKLMEDFPSSVHFQDALERGGDNAFLGCTPASKSGPSERRIDVAVMGDGFTVDGGDQDLQEEWAELCLEVLFNEDVFDEYRSYFNFWFVRLASLEEGVDPFLSEEEKKKIEERNKKRRKEKKVDFSTALDCKSAPGGQVYANRSLVYKWLGIADGDAPGCASDGLAIAFARFGRLGMGGSGVANVGRPDKSITVHEFGHAFAGLLDEYVAQEGPPSEPIEAPNAATTEDPELVPWAHFLRAKVRGVDVHEGGATYRKGVWRPANGCAMNSAGNESFCPVCREAAVLAIYRYIDPIDAWGPDPATPIAIVEGSERELFVVPMQPKHDLDVTWFVEEGVDLAPVEPRDPYADALDATPESRYRNPFLGGRYTGGTRHRSKRDAYDEPPAGERSRAAQRERGKRDEPDRWTFPLDRLDPGTYRITARVADPIEWVLKDEQHLLEERRTWTVSVTPKDAAEGR